MGAHVRSIPKLFLLLPPELPSQPDPVFKGRPGRVPDRSLQSVSPLALPVTV